MTNTTIQYNDVQGIYNDDHTPDYLKLFLDRTMLYTCAYFERENMTLEEAQLAKLDLALGKCDLQPGQTLLEVGCGCGECAFRAASQYGVNVVGLNPSQEQAKVARNLMNDLPPGSGRVEVLDHGWEEYHEPVDRIVSIGALEHIGPQNYRPFFTRCRELLPDGANMLIHCIVRYDLKELEARGIELYHEVVLFNKFIDKEIFPGGRLSSPEHIAAEAEAAGFSVERQHFIGEHYVKTLDQWKENLEQNREPALALRPQATYDRFIRYLEGCSKMFSEGFVDLCQFTMRAERAMPHRPR